MRDESARAAGPTASRVQGRERRASVRHASIAEASYQPAADVAAGPSCPARVWDVSLDGLSLIVPHPYQEGAVLSVVPDVPFAGRAGGLDVRVLHVEPHGGGLWKAGCEFLTPLTEDELLALLS